MEDNRYTLLREEFGRRYGEHHLVAVMKATRQALAGKPVHIRKRTMDDQKSVLLPIGDLPRVLSVLCTVDLRDDGSVREHVSLSVLDPEKGTISLPSWNQLVLVRAICWPDDVEVHQVLPALDGPHATPWISIHDVLHLIRRRD